MPDPQHLPGIPCPDPQSSSPCLASVPLDQIQDGRASLRRAPRAGLDGLAASLGPADAPALVQPPVLEQTGDHAYAIIAGERRILAARQAGWQSIPCLVHPRLDPLRAHRLRLVENLHRQELHPLDEAAAIKIAWLIANAQALQLEAAARAVLEQDPAAAQALPALQTLLQAHGFTPNHPAVTWEALLAQLGLDLDVERRKKLLGVLRVDAAVQEQARTLDLTEAGLRAIGTLEAKDQRRLVAAIAVDPGLARKARRIARVVRGGAYTLDEALAEARGQPPGETPSDWPEASGRAAGPPPETGDPPELPAGDPASAVMALLETANRLATALAALAAICGGELEQLPHPWGEYARQALALIGAECGRFSAPPAKGA